jgi:hypothetical protein
MRRAVAPLIVALVAVGVGWLVSSRLRENELSRSRHAYCIKNCGLVSDIAVMLWLAVRQTQRLPPEEPHACVRWLIDQDREAMVTSVKNFDEASGEVRDSLGVPLAIRFRDGYVVVSAAGPDKIHGTNDDFSATANLVEVLDSASGPRSREASP